MKFYKLLVYLFFTLTANFIYTQSIDLRIKYILEGPYVDNQMIGNLHKQGILPSEQPFNISPWNYNGNESWIFLPINNVIDWVLVDLVSFGNDTLNNSFELIDRKALLLRGDGQIVDVYGSDILTFQSPATGNPHLRIQHRNHLTVTSANPISEISPGLFEYDFTVDPNVFADGMSVQKQVSFGVWAAMSGDADINNQVNNSDKNDIWFIEKGTSGYLQADFNLDGWANEKDLIDKWNDNAGYGLAHRVSLLKVCAENPRYFCSGGQPVFLTGSHSWDNFQDIGDVSFNYNDYLNWLESLGHNFIRLWAWETPQGTGWAKDPDMLISPAPFKKDGTQFDLTQLNPEYFERLRQRLLAADEKGIYVSVMFFQGFSAEHDDEAWDYHPYNTGNNINGISSQQDEVHTNINPEIVNAQQMYMREVIDMVNYYEFTNVLYEIGNEIPHGTQIDIWLYDMIDYIHQYEFETYGVKRPVGMVFQYTNGTNQALFDSPADWISPGPDDGFDCVDPEDAPVSDGQKVIISDTDHFYYLKYHNGGNPNDVVWRSFTGGIQVIHMDNWGGGSNEPGRLHGGTGQNTYSIIRNNMGYARTLADQLDLISMIPHPEISSTGFCLASENELVAYLPSNVSSIILDLGNYSGSFIVKWLNTVDGEWQTDNNVAGGSSVSFTSPFPEYAVLVLSRVN